MPGIAIARFVIERDPERDYQIVESDGSQAQDLVDEAMTLLDLVGQPRPGGDDKLHAWIGPVGSHQRHYVRVVVERLGGGEVRFHQLWYSSTDLPTRPACIPWGAAGEVPRKSPGWPADIDRVVSVARSAAETAGSRQARVHPRADPLSYCDALAAAFGASLGPQITWVTTVTDRPVPVHLRLVADASVDEPEFSPTPVSPQPVKPRQLASPRIEHRPRTKRRRSVRSALLLILAGLVLGVFVGYLLRGPAGPPPAIDPQPSETIRSAVDIPPSSANAAQPDPAEEELRSQLLASYDAVLKLQNFLDQPGLAKDEQQTQIRETVVMTDLLDFGSVDKQKFSNAEIRRLLDLFEQLLALHPDHVSEAENPPPETDDD
jgi:hypothetical protein